MSRLLHMYVGLGAKLLTEIRADAGWILFLFKASILLAEALWGVSRERLGKPVCCIERVSVWSNSTPI